MRVYEYGLLRPDNEQELMEILRLAHRYHNTLIELEIERRAAVREIQSSVGDVAVLEAEIAEMVAGLDEARAEIQAGRKAKRSANTDSSTVAKERARGLRAQLKAKRALLTETKRKVREDPDIRARIKAQDALSLARTKAARAQCGLYWGTYLLVEQAVDAAKGSRTDPRFRRWDGGGSLGVQIQRDTKGAVGMDVSDVFGSDPRIQIDPVSDGAWTHPSRGERRRRSRTRVRLRIGSDGRKPIWAEWPIVMHRPLGSGRIKLVKALARRVQGKLRWVLQISVDDPPRPTGEGVIAIDLGWRQFGDELRVAYWRDDRGDEGDLRVPTSVKQRIEKAESIRGFRDQGLDALKASLEIDPSAVPEAIAGVRGLSTYRQWRSPARFHALLLRWRQAGGAPPELEAWHKRDDHLGRYEAGLRRGAILHRREVYRLFVAQVRARYSTVVLEEWDLRRIQIGRAHV